VNLCEKHSLFLCGYFLTMSSFLILPGVFTLPVKRVFLRLTADCSAPRFGELFLAGLGFLKGPQIGRIQGEHL
jgi:hypothetical protein